MAREDRSKRGKESTGEVAYFIPLRGRSYAFIGAAGFRYLFDKKNPGKIEDARDIKYLRAKNDVQETDSKGNPIGSEGTPGKRTPRSYSKTEPAHSLPEPEKTEDGGEVLTGDIKKKKKKEKKPEESEEDEEEEEKKEEGEKEEKPKKKKKKKKKKSSKSSEKKPKKPKKKKKDKKESDEDEWEEDEDED
jgi:hypothetical protein